MERIKPLFNALWAAQLKNKILFYFPDILVLARNDSSKLGGLERAATDENTSQHARLVT